jgi:hypothetical protein
MLDYHTITSLFSEAFSLAVSPQRSGYFPHHPDKKINQEGKALIAPVEQIQHSA